jgi:hypothetical protein
MPIVNGFLRVVLLYLIAPALTWTAGLYALLGSLVETGGVRSLVTALFVFVILAGYAYETGYKAFHMVGKKAYFAIVFVFPVVLAGLGILVCIIR